MAEVPGCWVCARSGVTTLTGSAATNWTQDAERFWRCTYGHLANIEQVKQLNRLKEEKEKENENSR